MSTIYIMDACALIDAAKEYKMSKKTFAPIWEAFDDLINSGQLITSSEIHDELKDDDLITWSKTHKDFLFLYQKKYRSKCLLF